MEATVAARDDAIAQLQQEVEARDSHIAHLSAAVAALEAGKAELAAQVAALQGQLAAEAQRGRQLEAALEEEEQQVEELQVQVGALRVWRGVGGCSGCCEAHHTQAPAYTSPCTHKPLHTQAPGGWGVTPVWGAAAICLCCCLCGPCRLCSERHLSPACLPTSLQVEGYERSRMALAKSFFENKMRSDAAKVIQRHWREHRLARMRQQQSEGYQVGGWGGEWQPWLASAAFAQENNASNVSFSSPQSSAVQPPIMRVHC